MKNTGQGSADLIIPTLILQCSNSWKTNVPHDIETSQLICITNHVTGFYIRGTLVVNGLTAVDRKLKPFSH